MTNIIKSSSYTCKEGEDDKHKL